MTIKEVYEKYKHLDKLLCDEIWLGTDKDDDGHCLRIMLSDCWQAIKEKEVPE